MQNKEKNHYVFTNSGSPVLFCFTEQDVRIIINDSEQCVQLSRYVNLLTFKKDLEQMLKIVNKKLEEK
jgi:hypothetical protein